MTYTFDACALLAFLNDEDGADTIEGLFNNSLTDETPVYMSVVNLLEVYYGELRDKGPEIAQIVLDTIRHYSIKIIDSVSEYAFHEAARLKSTYKIALADAIGLAAAIELSGRFVTSDHHELEAVHEREPGVVFWFR